MSVLRNLCSLFMVTASSLAAAAPRVTPRLTLDPPTHGPATGAVCGAGRLRCLAHVVLAPDGTISSNAAGLTPADLQAAYNITTNISGTPTVAIVDAYGYANLESDLATYRAQFGLPPCTRANGCLAVVNQGGQTSPLPDDPPANDDWTIETALDIDMVSAACPRCKILVVQADDNQGDGLFLANDAAASLHATVVSNSWGVAEGPGTPVGTMEDHFNHPGIAIFASGGDSGYDNSGAGANYPATSTYVIGVGGTSLSPSSNSRGWSESVWSSGGSGCSSSIPKPSFQPPSPCAFRASADVAAVGDPQTGVAVFSTNGGWMVIGGTSAAAPIVASIFASVGKGTATPSFVAGSASAFYDVTSGSNGSCGSILCNAGSGWDGPTGYGTPNAAALANATGGGGGGGGGLGVQITTPTENAHVTGAFPVVATATGPTAAVGLGIDGKLVSTLTMAPWVFHAPTLAAGPHTVQVAVADANQNVVVSEVHVIVDDLPPPDDLGSSDGTAACQAARGADAAPLAVVLLGLVMRRRRRTSSRF